MMMVAMNRLGDGLGRNTRAPTPNFGLIGVWVNECFSRGTVRLASADPRAQPIIEENMLDDPRDRLRMRDGVKRLLEMARHPGFAEIADLIATGPDGDSLDTLGTDDAIDHWVMQTAGDAQHGTSSCRMGSPADSRSVVDPRCRVIGYDGTARHRRIGDAQRAVCQHTPDHGDDGRIYGRQTGRCLMADSLQDQLRKAGLVNEKRLKKAQRQQHAVEMERKSHGAADEALAQAQRARAEKAARDKQLNEQRDQQAQAKAIAAQVKQLIEMNRQSRDGASIPFNFVDGKLVKKMAVSKTQQNHLVSGSLAIVKLGDRYELVPTPVAQKIRLRDPTSVIVCNDEHREPRRRRSVREVSDTG